MSISIANSQSFAIHASGQILGDGSGAIAFGCEIVRIAPGTYELRLPADSGLDPSQSYLFVTPRSINFVFPFIGVPSVIDLDSFVKTIITRGPDGSIGDLGFTFILYRSPLSEAT